MTASESHKVHISACIVCNPRTVHVYFRSYYESSELSSAIGVMEEALERHPELVSHECVNMAAELFIANHQHDKALEVRSEKTSKPFSGKY